MRQEKGLCQEVSCQHFQLSIRTKDRKKKGIMPRESSYPLSVCVVVCVTFSSTPGRREQGVGRSHSPPPTSGPSSSQPSLPGKGSPGGAGKAMRAPIPHKGMTQALTAYIRGVKSLS